MSEKQRKTFADYYNNPEWKAKFLARNKELIKCICGRDVTRGNLAKHRERSIHLAYLAKQQQSKLLDVVKDGLDTKQDSESFIRNLAITFEKFRDEQNSLRTRKTKKSIDNKNNNNEKINDSEK
jgi:hypothetical protein